MRRRVAVALAVLAVVVAALAWYAFASAGDGGEAAEPVVPAPASDSEPAAFADLASNTAAVSGRAAADSFASDDSLHPTLLAVGVRPGTVEVRGVARLSDGRPAAGAALALYFEPVEGAAPEIAGAFLPPQHGVPTDAGGAFAVAVARREAGERLRLLVSAPSRGAHGVGELVYPAEDEASVDVGVVVLELEELVCTGEVVDTGGAPVEGARPSVGFGAARGFSARGSGVNPAVTDARGRFELRGGLDVEASSGLRVLATRSGYAGDPVPLPERGGHARIVLRPVAPYRGLLVLPELVDTAGMSVESVLSDGVVVDRDFVDERGVFDVGVPEAGSWGLRLTGSYVLNEVGLAHVGHAADPDALPDAAPGRGLISRWTLGAGAHAVAVKVFDERGAPVEVYALGRLGAMPPRRRDLEQAVVFSGPSIDGVFHVEPGRWGRATFAPPAVELRLAEPIEVDVELEVADATLDGLAPEYVWIESPRDPLSSLIRVEGAEVAAGRATLTLPFEGEWEVHARFRPPSAPRPRSPAFGAEDDTVRTTSAYLAPGPPVRLRY